MTPIIPTYRCRACSATEHGCENLRTFAGRPCCPVCDHDAEQPPPPPTEVVPGVPPVAQAGEVGGHVEDGSGASGTSATAPGGRSTDTLTNTGRPFHAGRNLAGSPR